MNGLKVLTSSASVEWETPQAFFDELNKEFDFTLDVCATMRNSKCKRFFTKKQDAFKYSWGHEICWMNPPFGRDIARWVANAHFYGSRNSVVVGLLPARTDTRWFHAHVLDKAEIRFIKGRLKFGGSKWNAPFPCLLAIWRPH